MPAFKVATQAAWQSQINLTMTIFQCGCDIRLTTLSYALVSIFPDSIRLGRSTFCGIVVSIEVVRFL